MIINGYEFSTELEKLYNDVVNLVPQSKVNITILDNLPGVDSSVDGFQDTLPNRDISIYVKRLPYIESIISHELLHAYYLRKGYPDHFYACPEGTGIFHFGQLIYNHVIHKLILEEQIKRKIDIKNHQITLAKNLGKDYDKEFDDIKTRIDFSMVILLCEILCGDYKEIYEKRIKTIFPKSYEIANRLLNTIMIKNYETPFETRRAIVRAFKEFDNILLENNLPNFDLQHNVAITFIPSQRQLDLKVPQVFDYYKDAIFDIRYNKKAWVFISKADGQTSLFYIPNNEDEFENEINNMNVRELFSNARIIYSVR